MWSLPAPRFDLLVVDDGSPDGTGQKADELAAAHPGRISVLHRPGKLGLGTAYLAGFAEALKRQPSAVIQMDADFSHAPEELPGFVKALKEADAVFGSRYIPGGSVPHWPWHRRALSRWGNGYSGFMLACGVRDMTSGYRAYRRSTLEAVDYAGTRAVGYGFQIELAYRVSRWGGRIEEVPIEFTDRVRGHSKMSPSVAFEELWLVTWWSIRDRPWLGRRRRTGAHGTQRPKKASNE